MKSRRADRLLVEDMVESMGRIAASRLTDAARKRRGDIEWPLIVGLDLDTLPLFERADS